MLKGVFSVAKSAIRWRWRIPNEQAIPLLPIFAIFLTSRAALFALMGYTAGLVSPATFSIDSVASNLCQFDCHWFVSIASYGYSTAESAISPGATNYAFYPLFPLVMRATGLSGSALILAATALCNIFFFIALTVVYRYVRLLGSSPSVALTTVALLCALPQSIVFSVPYSDSLFFLLFALTTYWIRSEKFLLAGICAALLTATRANGIFILVFACVWIWRRHGWNSIIRPWQFSDAYVLVVLAPLGLFAFWAFCLTTTGDAFAYASTELHGWGWQFVSPWTGLTTALRIGGISQLAALISIAISVLTFILIRRGFIEEGIFCVCCVLLIWSSTMNGSVFRYWLPLFPLWFVVARMIDGRPLTTVMTFSVLSIANGALTCAWVLQNNAGI